MESKVKMVGSWETQQALVQVFSKNIHPVFTSSVNEAPNTVDEVRRGASEVLSLGRMLGSKGGGER